MKNHIFKIYLITSNTLFYMKNCYKEYFLMVCHECFTKLFRNLY